MNIYIEKLSKSYGSTKVLENLSLKIIPGDFISIVGKSGSGKSTLLNVLGLLDNNFVGNYFFNNIPISKLSKDKLSEIRNQKFGFIFQSYHLLPYMSVIDNIMLPTLYEKRNGLKKTSRLSDQLLKQLINDMGLSNLINKQLQYLSGGEKQRVAIIRAIIMNPQIILADEPTGNLDPENANIILGILKKLNTMGISIVMVTHNYELANQANKILYLENGGLYEK